MKALVIPSNREHCLAAFFDAWEKSGQADWDCVVLSEDADEICMKPKCAWPLYHSSHAEVRERLGDDTWIISKGDSARRCFGFLVAKELGAEWILTLDDDCLPIPGAPPICQAHLAAMQHTTCQPTAGMRTRGMPYRTLGETHSQLNMGLWQGNADVDGPQGLLSQPYFTPPLGNRLANPYHRYPLCGMNLFFAASLVPALYFPLMGEGQPYRRFDDIWAGWVFQKVAQHLGIPWSFGTPWVEHARASNPFANLVKEAPGIIMNETMWCAVDNVTLTCKELVGTVQELGGGLQGNSDRYIAKWGEALVTWCRVTGDEVVSASGSVGR